MIELLEALNESGLKRLDTVPAVFARGAKIVTATYDTVEDDPLGIITEVAARALTESPEDINASGSSGAGTSVSQSLNSAVTGTADTLAGILRKLVFAIQVDIWIPRDQVPAQIQVAVSPFHNQIGQALDNTILIQFDPSTARSVNQLACVELLFLPGMNFRGRRVYSAGAIGLAQALAGDANASPITIATTSLTSNNVVNSRLVTRGHEDVDKIVRFHGAALRKALACGCGSKAEPHRAAA